MPGAGGELIRKNMNHRVKKATGVGSGNLANATGSNEKDIK